MSSGPNAFRYVQALGLLAPAALSGVFLSYSTIVVPALLQSDASHLTKQMSYILVTGGKTTLPGGVATGALLGYLAYAARNAGAHTHVVRSYIGAAIGILLFVPYTFAFIVPTNKKIMDLHTKTQETREQYREGVMSEDGETIHQLVDKWAMRNLGRFVLTAVSSFVAIGTAVMDKTDYF